MSETSDSTPAAAPAATAPAPAPATPRPYWLYRFAAWVGIIAGIVFIVGSIFVGGMYAGGGFDHHHQHHCRHHHSMHHRPGDHPMHHRGDRPGDSRPMGPMAPPPGDGPSAVPSTSAGPPPAPAPTR